MADLLTHYATGRLVGLGIHPRHALLLGVGALVPDLLGKPLGALPFLPDSIEAPSHSLPGLFFACWGLSLLFAEGTRSRAFALFLGGSLLHVAVDGLKDYLGRGAIVPFHPLWLGAWECGCYRTEDVFLFIPADLGILLLAWIAGSARRTPAPA